MAIQAEDVGETISMSSEPSVPFAELPRDERRDVFFGLSEPAREALVADMSRSQLERFTDRLDPDEVTDVLGYANAETREAVLGTLDASGARRSTSCCRSIPRARPG